MKALEVEFRYRFWFIGAILAVGFWLYIVDRHNASQSLALPLSKVDGISADLNTRVIFWMAAALALLAALLRTWATAYLRAEVMVDTTVRTERLVADGPYRFVRNPLYLANILLACAMATMASRVGAVVIVLGMILFSLRLINREEAGLALSQGILQALSCNGALLAAVGHATPAGQRGQAALGSGDGRRNVHVGILAWRCGFRCNA